MRRASNREPGFILNRRDFLKYSAATTVVVGSSPWQLRAGSSANNRIALGMIGVGDRAATLMKDIFSFSEKQNAHITAICDVWKINRETAAGRIAEKYGTAPRQFSRFNELLALKDIDGVVIATPDFWHGPILNAALEAGKDVYIEKPMTIDLPQANQALDLARAKKRIVQTGTQRRSDGHFLAAAQEVVGGALGKVSRISAFMGDNNPRWARSCENCKQPDVDWAAYMSAHPGIVFDPKLLRRWQLYKLSSNGIPGLWMTHYTDAVSLLTGARCPSQAVALGDRYVWKTDREHPDTFQALLEYPEGFLFDFGMGLGNASGIHFTVQGTHGTLDAEKWTLEPEKKSFEPRTVTPVEVPHHMENWLTCLRSRQLPAADIQFGHQHVVATVMAARAFETGRRQKYEPATRTICEA